MQENDSYNCSNLSGSVASSNVTRLHVWPAITIERAVPLSMLLGFIICCTILGNILVLLALITNKNLRSSTAVFIANLALADLLLGTTVLPFSASLEITGNRWLFGYLFCDIWAALDVLCCTASILSLCVISLDRYVGVTRPLQHTVMFTQRRALFIVVAIWLLAALVSVLPLMGWKKRALDAHVCTVTDELTYVLFSVLVSFYLPTGCILVVYYRIYREALKQSRFLYSGIKKTRMRYEDEGSQTSSELITLRVHTGGNQSKLTSDRVIVNNHSIAFSDKINEEGNMPLQLAGKMARFKREKKAAKTLGIVVGVFIFCWLPFFVILPLGSICKDMCRAPDIVFKIAFWLGYCNSLCNPIIYARWNKEFKSAFSRILSCQWCRTTRNNKHTQESICLNYLAAATSSNIIYRHQQHNLRRYHHQQH